MSTSLVPHHRGGAGTPLLPFGRYAHPRLKSCGADALVRPPGGGHVPTLDDPVLVTHTILSTARRVDHHEKAAIA